MIDPSCSPELEGRVLGERLVVQGSNELAPAQSNSSAWRIPPSDGSFSLVPVSAARFFFRAGGTGTVRLPPPRAVKYTLY